MRNTYESVISSEGRTYLCKYRYIPGEREYFNHLVGEGHPGNPESVDIIKLELLDDDENVIRELNGDTYHEELEGLILEAYHESYEVEHV